MIPLRRKNMLNSWTALAICFYCLSHNFSEQFRKHAVRKE